jgi:hypothetical protein
MSKFDNPLKDVKIASPCSANWDEMYGDERKRFCGECKLNVYNLSGMTHYDAENLLRNVEGRMCVRFYRRSDGTILTQDCPVGWAKVKQRFSVFATAAASLIFTLLGGIYFASLFGKNTSIALKLPIPFATPTPEPLMGAIAIPSPTPKASPTPKEREVMGQITLKDDPDAKTRRAAGLE